MLKIKIVYKFVLIVLLVLSMLGLVFSAFAFLNDNYSPFIATFHKICGFTIVLVTILHIIVKKKKLIKLTNEFLDVALKRKNPSYCNMDRLIMATSNHSVESIAYRFNLNADELFELLKENKVKVKSKEQTFKEIAKLNDEKIFYAVVLILELKLNDKVSNIQSCHT